MTVRGLLLALALLIAAPVEAASQCHRYSRWYYPWPQSCAVRFVALARRPSRPVTPTAGREFDIPLPFLARADLVGGEADEVTAARLTLLGYAYAH